MALDDLRRDLVLATRMLRRTPAFTSVALLTLALAIGGNAAIFSLINALLLRPLPVPQADRLTLLRIQPGDYGYSFCVPIVRYLESHTQPVFSDVFAFSGHTFQTHGAAATERIKGALVSGQYFSGLGVTPELGRYLTAADDQPGGGSNGPTAVISHRFWQAWFDGNTNVLGRKIVLDNVAFTIVGVMPPAFASAEVGTKPDIFASLATEPLVDAPYNNTANGWHSWWLRTIARLRPGVSQTQAEAFLRATSRQTFEAAIPDPNWRFNNRKRSELYLAAEPGATGYSYLRLRFRKPLIALMALVGVVLLIACLNLASLLLARAAAREREIATRFALGASRSRLLQQLLTETLLLAVTGSLLGFALSPLLSRALARFLSTQDNPMQFDVSPDSRVLLFTAAIAALATILTGLLPALRSTSRALQERLREASTSLRGGERRRLWPRVLLAGEVGLALVLVTGAGLLGYSLVQLHDVPLGFEPRGLLMLSMDMDKQTRSGETLVRLYQQVSEELARLPGVAGASYLNVNPISNSWWSADIALPGQPTHELYRNQVGPGYFAAMRTPLLTGREFRWSDTDKSGSVAILNQAAARVLFPDRNPIGQRIKVEKDESEIVGVVADTKYANVRDAPVPTVFSSITQGMKKDSFTALLRIDGAPGPVIAAARSIVRRIAPEVPAPEASNMEAQIDESLATERMMALLALFFAALALLITAVGLYGTLAYTTARRTGEIGIRMALGAQRQHVLKLVCKENIAIAIGGCLLGLIASLAASRFIASFLYSTSPRNPAILSAAALLLVTIASAASLIPAVRASRIDPMTAIRYE